VNRDSENAKIMQWLSPLDPGTTHSMLQDRRFKGLGDWFLKKREFVEWWAGEGVGYWPREWLERRGGRQCGG